MKDYQEFNLKFLPLTHKDCKNKQTEILGMIGRTNDQELENKLKSLLSTKCRENALWYTYLTIALTGVAYTRFKYMKPHFAGIGMCIAFSYGLGHFMSYLHSFDEIVNEIGEIPYPDIENERKDYIIRCRVARNLN